MSPKTNLCIHPGCIKGLIMKFHQKRGSLSRYYWRWILNNKQYEIEAIGDIILDLKKCMERDPTWLPILSDQFVYYSLQKTRYRQKKVEDKQRAVNEAAQDLLTDYTDDFWFLQSGASLRPDKIIQMNQLLDYIAEEYNPVWSLHFIGEVGHVEVMKVVGLTARMYKDQKEEIAEAVKIWYY